MKLSNINKHHNSPVERSLSKKFLNSVYCTQKDLLDFFQYEEIPKNIVESY